jgi:hypothetical protein
MVQNEIIMDVYTRFKEQGFPYYSTDRKWRDEQFQNLVNFKRELIIDRKNKIIGQNPNGLSLAWSFMEHAWGIKCGKMRTPMEIWEDEEHLKKGINKILSGTFFTQKEHYEITESDMRSMLRRYSGTQMVSNFRPTAAAALYDVFVDKESVLEGTEAGTVWDPSMGYGGRLLGAIAAGVNYIGTDPCIPTYEGLEKIRDTYGDKYKNYTLLRQGSETYIPEDESLDFVFTSPPYFGWEQYGDEDEQSFKAYPEEDLWKEKFLKQTFANAFKGLKPGKFMAMNVANTKQYKSFEEDTVSLAESVGFKQTDTWWLSLSTQQKDANQKREETKDFPSGRKYEPTFIFQKQ